MERIRKAMASQTAKDGIGALDALYSLAVEHGVSETVAAGFAHNTSGALATMESQVHDEIYRLSLMTNHLRRVENMLREALTCVGQKSEGELGLLELVEQCTVWMKEKKCPN